MKQINKLFNGKKLRAVYDRDNKIWLVSVVDTIAAITGSNYDIARNYWKQLKLRLKNRNHPLTKKNRQLKLIAKDGLYRCTDVMDYKEIVKLVQALPYKTAMAVKNWVGGIACTSKKIKKDLEKCIKEVLMPREHCFIKYTSVRRIF